MSARADFTAAVWELLTNDAVLLAEIGTSEVNLFPSMAPRDHAMPYGVYSVSWGPDWGQLYRGSLNIDWWDYGDSSSRIERIAAATKAVLSDSQFEVAGDFAAGRCYSPSESLVATDSEMVWRYQMIFPCRVYDCMTADSISARSY